MPKEILLYGGFNDFSADFFMREMEAAKDDDILLRINTDGGEPQSVFGLINKFQEHKGAKTIRVDGKAFSTGAFFLAYADLVEALDVSQIQIHRAAFSRFFENNEELFNESSQKMLSDLNKNLRAALEAKIDTEKFKKITGKTLKDVFSMDSRIEVVLTAKEAKQIKLVDKIIPITPKMTAEINSNVDRIAANYSGNLKIESKVNPDPDPNPNPDPNLNIDEKMTLEELKSKHSNLYAQVLELGKDDERDRSLAWMEFADVDIEAVKKGIEGKGNLSQKSMAEFAKKLMSAKNLSALETESVDDVTTDTPEGEVQTEKEKAEAKFLAEVKLNLKTPSDE